MCFYGTINKSMLSLFSNGQQSNPKLNPRLRHIKSSFTFLKDDFLSSRAVVSGYPVI